MIKMALCRFAVEDYAAAHAGFNDALAFVRGSANGISDHRQLAEVLNNLGCLVYMQGEVEKANDLMEKSLDVQTYISEQSLYTGSKFSCHSSALNGSVTKANVGLIALVTKDASMSITALEVAFRVSHPKQSDNQSEPY